MVLRLIGSFRRRSRFVGAGLIVLGVLHGVTTREAIAANRYWVLATGSSGSYNSTARWSTTSNGSSGASVPGPSDVAIFDGGNGTKQGACTSTTDWKGIQITSNYTGTVTSSATLNLGTDGFVQGGGTFVAPSTRLTVSGAFTRTGGTFTPNSGLVMLTAASGNRTFATNNGSFHDLMINDGLVGYWKLDDGTTPISDRSGYGHSGTLYNIPTWGAGTTALQFSNGNAMVLNGTDEYARISRTTTLEPTAVSVSIWIKRNGNQSQYARIVDKTYSNGGAAPYQSYALQMNNNATKHGQIHWEVGLSGGGTSSSSSGDTTITDGTWHHVVGVYDPAGSAPQQRLYINGVLYASATVTTALAYDTATTGDLYFGQSGGSNQYFKGTIDDLRIYNRGLTSADVATLYAGGQRVTSAATHTLSGTITTTGELVLASGTLDASASGCSSASCGITVGETWYSYGGTFTPRTGTVAFNGTGSILSDWSPFYDLSVTGTGTVTLLDRLNVTNTLGMSANGTLAGSTYVIRAGTMNKTTGTISGSGSIVLAPTANLNLTVNNVGLPLRLESPKDDGLVGYWKLDDGRGGTAADSSGNGYDGALSNGAGWTTNTPGTMPIDDAGSIALTSTSSQFVRIPRNTTLEPAAVTVAAWIKRSGNQNRYAKLIIKTY
ncbi:MAG TPA: LamG domain-containing protein, partial [Polyangia bacterium]